MLTIEEIDERARERAEWISDQLGEDEYICEKCGQRYYDPDLPLFAQHIEGCICPDCKEEDDYV